MSYVPRSFFAVCEETARYVLQLLRDRRNARQSPFSQLRELRSQGVLLVREAVARLLDDVSPDAVDVRVGRASDVSVGIDILQGIS